MIKAALVLAVVAALVAGDTAFSQEKNGGPGAGATGLVRGNVVLAPACPGPARLDRPECRKRPIETSVRVFGAATRGGNADDRPLTIVTTDPSGRFRIELPAGSYRLEPVSPSRIARAKPVEVTVSAGSTIDVELSIDSGMR